MAAIVLVASVGPATVRPAPVNFDGSDWIWSASAGPELSSFGAGVNYFRAELTLPRKAPVESAEVIVTADNLFALYVNGHSVGASGIDNSAWRSPRRLDVAELLVPGRNVFAVEAVNTLPGSAALLLKAVVRLAGGEEITLRSGEA